MDQTIFWKTLNKYFNQTKISTEYGDIKIPSENIDLMSILLKVADNEDEKEELEFCEAWDIIQEFDGFEPYCSHYDPLHTGKIP